MKRSKYQVSEKVRAGAHRRKVSHALGNSRISGFAEELGGCAIRNRIIIFSFFMVFIVTGLYFVIW